MNFTSIQMQQTLRRLEAAMPDITPEQRRLLDDLNTLIEESGRHYMDADMLWDGVAVWAENYGIKSLKEY